MLDWVSSIEKDYDLEILFAAETGSRAWGLENEHSDFDIRFIYRCRSFKNYLSLKKDPLVLDFQSPFDVSGFDVLKAFELMAKSNPGIYEWAYSPVIYKDRGQFSVRLKRMIEENYSPYSLCKHYGSLCRRNIKETSKGGFSFKKQKQLLQAVRAELLRTGMIKLNKVCSPFDLIENAKTDGSKLFSVYHAVTEAKRKCMLLSAGEIDRITHLLELSLEETEEKNGVRKTGPFIDKLNQWIWEIFGIS